jgi:hypothetical protein
MRRPSTFKRGGCGVNQDGVVQIPSRLVEECSDVPSRLSIHTERRKLLKEPGPLEWEPTFFVRWIWKRRIAFSAADVVNAANTETISEIDFIASSAYPQDIPVNVAYIASFRALLKTDCPFSSRLPVRKICP